MNLLTILTLIPIGLVYSQKVESNFRCGEDWLRFGDEKCYKVIKTSLTRDEAASACVDAVSRSLKVAYFPGLLTIKSRFEQKYIKDYIENELNIKGNIWIGARRAGNKPYFEWEDGSDMKYQNWANDLPTNDSERNCAQFMPNSGEWVDISCDSKAYVVCEKFQFWTFPDLQKSFYDWRRQLAQKDEELTVELWHKQRQIMSLQKSSDQLTKNFVAIDKEFHDFKTGFVSYVNTSIEELTNENREIRRELLATDDKLEQIVEALLALHSECENGCSGGGGSGGVSDKDLENLRKELLAEINAKYKSLKEELKNTLTDARLTLINHRRTLQIQRDDKWISLGNV